METITVGDTKVYEGTWDEIVKHADEFNGHRLRVRILSDSNPADPVVELKPAGRFAARMERERANAQKPTTKELKEAEEELRELKRNMNQNRRRDGAEILFPDV